jgi:hypothetical protein
VHLQRELAATNEVLTGGVEMEAEGLGLHPGHWAIGVGELGDEVAGSRVTWYGVGGGAGGGKG